MFREIEYIISKIIKKLHLRAIKNSLIDKTSSIAAGTQFVNSTMDKHSFCGYDCVIVNTTIGKFSSIASNCEIGLASHSIDWISTSPVFNENKDQIKKKYSYHKYIAIKDTKIGNDVWIGSKSLIKSGISIGDGSVIGMGSIVIKDVPPYEIWAGNPAKFIRKRFDDETVLKLCEIRWWEFDDKRLCEYAKHANDVKKFLEEVNNDK